MYFQVSDDCTSSAFIYQCNHSAVSINLALSSILFLVFRHEWSYLFNSDPGMSFISYAATRKDVEFDTNYPVEVVSLVASILPLVALFQVFDGATAITGGIFRARGKQVSRCVRYRCPLVPPFSLSLQVLFSTFPLTMSLVSHLDYT